VDDGTHRSRDDLPAGEFCVWLQDMRAALRHAADADVPCGDCCACCTTAHFVHIGPDDPAQLAVLAVRVADVFLAGGLTAGGTNDDVIVAAIVEAAK
jgi:hypothetical protein